MLNKVRVTSTGNSGVMSVISKALTFAAQALIHGAALVDSCCWLLSERFAVSRKSTAGNLLLWSKIDAFPSVHEGLCSAGMPAQGQGTVVLRMLRSGDNRLQTMRANTLLPNYWANCLLIQQLVLALCVAEDGRAGAQWHSGCPCGV